MPNFALEPQLPAHPQLGFVQIENSNASIKKIKLVREIHSRQRMIELDRQQDADWLAQARLNLYASSYSSDDPARCTLCLPFQLSRRCWNLPFGLVHQPGVIFIHLRGGGDLAHHKLPYAHDHAPPAEFAEAVEALEKSHGQSALPWQRWHLRAT